MMIKRKSSSLFTNHGCFVPSLPHGGSILFGELLIIHIEFVLSLHRTLVLLFSSRCCNICHFTFMPTAFMGQINIPVCPFRLFLTGNPTGSSVHTATGACVLALFYGRTHACKPAVSLCYLVNWLIFWVDPIKSNLKVTLNALN